MLRGAPLRSLLEVHCSKCDKILVKHEPVVAKHEASRGAFQRNHSGPQLLPTARLVHHQGTPALRLYNPLPTISTISYGSVRIQLGSSLVEQALPTDPVPSSAHAKPVLARTDNSATLAVDLKQPFEFDFTSVSEVNGEQTVHLILNFVV